MSHSLEVRTSHRDMADVVRELAPFVDDTSIRLPAGERIADGEWVRFTVHLIDGSTVLEGVGRCQESTQEGASTFRVRLSLLDFDARNEIMFERICLARENNAESTGTFDVKAMRDKILRPRPTALAPSRPPPPPSTNDRPRASSAPSRRPPPLPRSPTAVATRPSPRAPASRPPASQPPAAKASRRAPLQTKTPASKAPAASRAPSPAASREKTPRPLARAPTPQAVAEDAAPLRPQSDPPPRTRAPKRRVTGGIPRPSSLPPRRTSAFPASLHRPAPGGASRQAPPPKLGARPNLRAAPTTASAPPPASRISEATRVPSPTPAPSPAPTAEAGPPTGHASGAAALAPTALRDAPEETEPTLDTVITSPGDVAVVARGLRLEVPARLVERARAMASSLPAETIDDPDRTPERAVLALALRLGMASLAALSDVDDDR